MKIIYLNLIRDNQCKSAEDFINKFPDRHRQYVNFSKRFPVQIIHLQRANFQETWAHQEIRYDHLKDKLPAYPRWWQEPTQLFDQAEQLKPDIIEISGLNLPLQFRSLRRKIGYKVPIIGRHMRGEDLWPNRKIWLQQFGLRVADGFIFFDQQVYQTWLKASVVLKKQQILILGSLHHQSDKDFELIYHFYSDLLSKQSS